MIREYSPIGIKSISDNGYVKTYTFNSTLVNPVTLEFIPSTEPYNYDSTSIYSVNIPISNDTTFSIQYTAYPPQTSSVTGGGSSLNVSNLTNVTIPSTIDLILNDTKNIVESTIDTTKEISQKIWDKFSGIENRKNIILAISIITGLIVFILIIVAVVHKNNPKKENAN